jgi:hypothetical protein
LIATLTCCLPMSRVRDPEASSLHHFPQHCPIAEEVALVGNGANHCIQHYNKCQSIVEMALAAALIHELQCLALPITLLLTTEVAQNGHLHMNMLWLQPAQRGGGLHACTAMTKECLAPSTGTCQHCNLFRRTTIWHPLMWRTL